MEAATQLKKHLSKMGSSSPIFGVNITYLSCHHLGMLEMNKKHPRLHRPSLQKTPSLIRPAFSFSAFAHWIDNCLGHHRNGQRDQESLYDTTPPSKQCTLKGKVFENYQYILSIKFDPCPKRVPFNDHCFTTKIFYNNLGGVMRTPYNPTKQGVGVIYQGTWSVSKHLPHMGEFIETLISNGIFEVADLREVVDILSQRSQNPNCFCG